MKKNAEKKGADVIAANRKAFHDYFIEDVFEAGIELKGFEVKSMRLHNVNLRDGYAVIRDGEAWLMNVHVSPYRMATMFPVDPLRDRRLLLHRSEINKLRGKVEQKGFTLVPLKMYFKDSLVKVEIGVARGKQLHDKRAAIAERDSKRALDRVVKEYRK